MDDEKTLYKAPVKAILRVTSGASKDTSFPLAFMKDYTIGRGEDCDIRIYDSGASRKHAILRVQSEDIILEDLNSTNGTFVNDRKIEKINLTEGCKVRIGPTNFILEGIGKEKKRPKSGSVMKIGGIAGGVLLILILGLAVSYKLVTSNSKDPDVVKVYEPPVYSSTDISSADKEKSREYFRNGLFLYNAGNLKKALIEWEHALQINPSDPVIRRKFMAAEEELEKMIDEHYKQAMINKKYLRDEEALNEFRIVMELVRNKNDQRYINSMNQIREIENAR